MGIVWGDIVSKDPLFTYATLPQGWTKKLGERDPRHMHLVDADGKVRAYIFFKNTSYDRTAHMSVCSD
jgi:hypothetical protein